MATKQKWAAFPHPPKAYTFAGDALKKNWEKLHRGDCEPFPKDSGAQEAWRLFHQGRFADSVAAGLAAGGAGVTAANKAQAIYANSLETGEANRIALFEEAMKRAEAQARAEPRNANAHYLYAYAAGRYSQRISVAKALAQGYGGRIKAALEGEEHFRKALKLTPDSPIAHIEMANGLVMMRGKAALEEAGKLYAKAAGLSPRDAMEKLDVEAAKAELE